MHIHAINVTIILFSYKNTISSNFAIWRSVLFSHVMLCMYMKLVYVWGGGGGSSGPSQENFEMKWYKSCKSDRDKFGLSIRKNVFVFYF